MRGNRGGRSRFQVWVAVPVTGLVAGAGLAALTAQGLDLARVDRTEDLPSAADEVDGTGLGEEPVAAAARRVRPTLLQPRSALSPAAPAEPTPLIVATVLDGPVWSSGVDWSPVDSSSDVAAEVAPTPVPAPASPPAPAVVDPLQPAPPASPPTEPQEPTPVVEDPTLVVEEPTDEASPPVEEPGSGTEEPPVEQPTDPPVEQPPDPVEQTETETGTTGSTGPAPPGPLVESAG